MHPLAPPLPSRHHAPAALQLGPSLAHLGHGLADLVGHFFAPILRSATVSFTPLGLWIRKIAIMSYIMSRGGSGFTVFTTSVEPGGAPACCAVSRRPVVGWWVLSICREMLNELDAPRALERVGACSAQDGVAHSARIFRDGSKASRGHLPRPPERAGWAERRIVGSPKRQLRHYMSAQVEQEAVGWLFY